MFSRFNDAIVAPVWIETPQKVLAVTGASGRHKVLISAENSML
jgi:hypothetical protein